MKRLSKNFSLKWNSLYAPTRYRTLETQLQTFILGQFHTYLQFRGEEFLNTFIVTNANDCPNLLSHGATFRMVYYFLTTQRKMLQDEKMYSTSRLIHLRVHHQMSSRSCKIYDWSSTKSSTIQVPYWVLHQNSTKNSTNWVQCTSTQKTHPVPPTWYRTQHNWLLLSGPPHPPQLPLEEWQQNRSIQYKYIQKLHMRHHWDTVCMSSNPQFRSVNQVNH